MDTLNKSLEIASYSVALIVAIIFPPIFFVIFGLAIYMNLSMPKRTAEQIEHDKLLDELIRRQNKRKGKNKKWQ